MPDPSGITAVWLLVATEKGISERLEGEAINYRTLIESLNHVVFTLDDQGRFMYLSPGCNDILGLTPQELRGKPITSVVVKDDHDRLCAKYRNVLRGKSFPSDYHVLDTGGNIHHVRAVSQEFTDEQGRPGVIGVISEIQNWETVEESLRRSEDKFTGLIGRSWDGILLTSESGALVEWNPAMEQITGFPRSDVLGKNLWDVYFALIPGEKRTPEHLDLLKSQVTSLLETGQSAGFEHTIEHEIQCPDGQVRVIESCMFTIPAGNTFMAGAILRDITSRKRSELEREEANRKLNLMSSITRHDINNQLTIFNGYLTLLEVGTPSMKSGEIISILQGATSKIQRILKFTREYQDVGVKSPAWQELGETIRLAKTTVEVGTVRFLPGNSCDGVMVYADPMLVRVFSNLIDNSLRHGENVSEIRIDCRREERHLVIVYEDNGIGIADRIRPVLFERGKGKNTGYGMFLIREILAITGFTIAETGVPGKGVRFEISIPEGSFRPKEKKQPS
jgi:PAS domain S-box-containing protein